MARGESRFWRWQLRKRLLLSIDQWISLSIRKASSVGYVQHMGKYLLHRAQALGPAINKRLVNLKLFMLPKVSGSPTQFSIDLTGELMELMNQPFNGQLGNRLIELLDSQQYHTVNIAVAFAKNSGVLRIKDAIERFRERGGTVNAFVGVDLGGTSYEALTNLLLHTDSLNVIHSEKAQTFHVKIYQFLGNEKGLIIVGSHNLTGGGLWTNFESSVIATLESSSKSATKILTTLEEYISKLSSLNESFLPITTQSDVDKLLQNGYVSKEVSEQIRQAKAMAHSGTQKRLFGNGAPANIPRIAIAKKPSNGKTPLSQAAPVLAPPSDYGPTIWFETKKMTGGSRNILDLSMKSLVSRGEPKGTPFDFGAPGFMRGGIEFFGIDPADTKQVKNITLNFEGFDYSENTILFPVGSNANGTWRLQIKGIRSSGEKITSAFKDKGEAYYLVNKIITFTKITEEYFFLSVFPESELENFEEASYILARNGLTNNAKRLGFI